MTEPQVGSMDTARLQYGKLLGSTPTVRCERHIILPGAAQLTGGLSVVPLRGDSLHECRERDRVVRPGRRLRHQIGGPSPLIVL
jgi:hypothetical protein